MYQYITKFHRNIFKFSYFEKVFVINFVPYQKKNKSEKNQYPYAIFYLIVKVTYTLQISYGK